MSIPEVRWLPPETLALGTFARESDVYSLGVTMWEVASWGALPHAHLSNAEVVAAAAGPTAHHLRLRLPRPPAALPDLYTLILVPSKPPATV